MGRHRWSQCYALLPRTIALALFAASVGGASLAYAWKGDYFSPGNLLVSRTVYDSNPNTVTVGEPLPPNCMPTSGSCSPPAAAIHDGTYPRFSTMRRLTAVSASLRRLFLIRLLRAESW